MGKNPAFQFYPSDWTRDLDDQDLEIEGAWIRICCRLWWNSTKGTATKDLTEWSNILRTHPNKTRVILKTLLEKGIAGGVFLDNQNITITSRRMVRDQEISLIRQTVGKLGGNPGLIKIKENLLNQKLTKSASLLSSSSTSKIKIYTDDFLKFYSVYPKKVGKDDAWRAWLKRNGTRPSVDVIISAVNRLKDSKQWKENGGQFIPNPSTWIHRGGWDDEPEVQARKESW